MRVWAVLRPVLVVGMGLCVPVAALCATGPGDVSSIRDLAPLALAVIGGLALVGLILRHAFRPRSALTIALSTAPGIQGEFKVRVDRQPLPPELQEQLDPRVPPNVRLGGWIYRVAPSAHVSLGTLHAGSWHVAVAGYIAEPVHGKTLGEFREQRCVRLRRGETRTLEFDFRPRASELRLRVMRSGDPVAGARVACADSGTSIRSTGSDGCLDLELPLAARDLLVGHEGRVVRKCVQLTPRGPDRLTVDLDREPDRPVDGCPEAVEPMLLGDLPRAAQALEDAGMMRSAHRVRGEHRVVRAETVRAVEDYAKAGQLVRAAELLESLEQWDDAAEAYLQGGAPARAAALYRRVENWAAAAGAYERAELFGEAVECYEQAGAPTRAASLLERAGLPLRAAESSLRGSSPPASSEESVAPVPDGAAERYEILEELGRGTMGIVFKAYDRVLNRTVALKRLPHWMADSPRGLDLFLEEARAVARLSHPHIVTVYDVVREGDTYFVTMEYLDGSTLRQVLEQRGPFPPEELVRVAKQALSALAHAHGQGIVHRDVKSSNLMMNSHGSVKVTDFGLAGAIEVAARSASQADSPGGTPHYMAPEQIDGRADARSDLYSLGVSLFELSTGQLPFGGPDVLDQHRRADRPRPRETAPEVPPLLEEVIRRLMAVEPASRFQGAEEVLEVLDWLER